MEKEEIIRGINVFADGGREYDESVMEMIDIGSITGQPSVPARNELKKVYKGKDYRSKFRNNALKEEQMQKQVVSELEFSRRMDDLADMDAGSGVYGGHSSGVLPIQIEVPTSGQVYRFAKSIIKPEDELSVSVIYTQMWINDLVKWLIVLIILLVIYLNRKKLYKLFDILKVQADKANKLYKENESLITKVLNSYITTIVLFVLFILFALVSLVLAVVFFSLFLVSVINLIINFSKNRKHEPLTMEDDIKEEEIFRLLEPFECEYDFDEIDNEETNDK